jgi:hypothetical protein
MRAIACAKSVAGGSSINDLWIFQFSGVRRHNWCIKFIQIKKRGARPGLHFQLLPKEASRLVIEVTLHLAPSCLSKDSESEMSACQSE